MTDKPKINDPEALTEFLFGDGPVKDQASPNEEGGGGGAAYNVPVSPSPYSVFGEWVWEAIEKGADEGENEPEPVSLFDEAEVPVSDHLTNVHECETIDGIDKPHQGATMDTQVDTLAHFKGRPMVNPRDFSQLPSTTVMGKLVCDYDGSFDSQTRRSSQGEALQFYLLNHCVSVLMQRRSDDDVLSAPELKLMREYHRYLGLVSNRVFNYLFLICMRECRHLQQHPESQWRMIFGEKLYNWMAKRIQGRKQDTAAMAYKHARADFTVGQVTRMLAAQYFWGRYDNSFGGPKWGEVALTLSKFVHGEISAEIMVDTAWTLAHNTGPIFNKGMIYHPQENGLLMDVLNTQRSGLVPGWAETLSQARVKGYFQHDQTQIDEFRSQMAMAKAAVPEAFEEFSESKVLPFHRSALYPDLDFSFGFMVPKSMEYLTEVGENRTEEYYDGSIPKPNPNNVYEDKSPTYSDPSVGWGKKPMPGGAEEAKKQLSMMTGIDVAEMKERSKA